MLLTTFFYVALYIQMPMNYYFLLKNHAGSVACIISALSFIALFIYVGSNTVVLTILIDFVYENV